LETANTKRGKVIGDFAQGFEQATKKPEDLERKLKKRSQGWSSKSPYHALAGPIIMVSVVVLVKRRRD